MEQIGKTIRVLVVDDSAFSRQTIKSILEKDPAIEVVGIASDGINAITKTLKLKPDLITLDLEMPEMDGFSFLRWLMQQTPTPVIMVSSYGDSKTVFKALELGAVDFIAKPTIKASVELKSIEDDLLRKVKGMDAFNLEAMSRARRPSKGELDEALPLSKPKGKIGLVAIGSSTGGPPALQHILSELPGDLSSAIVISQHMPKGFTKSLAYRLDKLCRLEVKEAEADDVVSEGRVLICPGGRHMAFRRRGEKVRVVLKKPLKDDMYTPSVDVMMRSVADIYGSSTMGVVLTGMGNDGKEGMKAIMSAGGFNIVEGESTAVVFGMPSEVIKAGAAHKVKPLNLIAREILRTVRAKSGK